MSDREVRGSSTSGVATTLLSGSCYKVAKKTVKPIKAKNKTIVPANKVKKPVKDQSTKAKNRTIVTADVVAEPELKRIKNRPNLTKDPRKVHEHLQKICDEYPQSHTMVSLPWVYWRDLAHAVSDK
jgi:hypothetical protein